MESSTVKSLSQCELLVGFMRWPQHTPHPMRASNCQQQQTGLFSANTLMAATLALVEMSWLVRQNFICRAVGVAGGGMA